MDLMFEAKLNIGSITNITIPNVEHDYGGINDQFAFGSSEDMSIYSSLHYFLSHYAKQDCIFQPESLLKWHLDHNKVEIDRIKLMHQIVSKHYTHGRRGA
jgi:hypothetical protein